MIAHAFWRYGVRLGFVQAFAILGPGLAVALLAFAIADCSWSAFLVAVFDGIGAAIGWLVWRRDYGLALSVRDAVEHDFPMLTTEVDA